MLEPGEYHRRMALVRAPAPEVEPITGAQQQLNLMRAELRHIFAVVEPRDEHREVFGHATRNLLIMASTEFEAQCKGILLANDVPPSQTKNIKHYARLQSPLKLGDYEVYLPMYPRYGSFKPLAPWTPEPLWWYQSYNKTKHDRENSFSEATLHATICAVAACEIITAAQWNGMTEPKYTDALDDLIRPIPTRGGGPRGFVSGVPQWFGDESYQPDKGQLYRPVPYDFSGAASTRPKAS